MTLKEVCEKVMAYMDEVSSENMLQNLNDDKYRIYAIIDSTQREIASLALPIKREVKLTAENKKITLPQDVYEPIALLDSEGDFATFKNFAPQSLFVSSDGEYTLFYHAYPTKITPQTAQSAELEISPLGQDALVFGTCAGLFMNTEPKLYDTFMDRYTAALNNLISKNSNMPFVSVTGGEII